METSPEKDAACGKRNQLEPGMTATRQAWQESECSVPEYILDDFAKEAGERFGFEKGSKSNLFIAM